MKILLIFLILFNLHSVSPEAIADNYPYAQVLQSGCYLYKTPLDNTNYTNTYFLLEPSYFVQLLSEYNSEFFKVRYMDVLGYVKKNQVQCVQGVPSSPYLSNIKFRVFGSVSRSLNDKPYLNTNNPVLKEYLPLYCDDLIYYGKIYGESAVEERTNIWYYCKYTVTGETGYVYSDSCDKMTEIVKNTERLAYVSSPQWSTTASASPQLVSVSSKPFKVWVVVICIPFAVFAFFLVKLAYKRKEKQVETDFNPFD